MDNGLLEEQQPRQQRPRLHIIADDGDDNDGVVPTSSSSRSDQHHRKHQHRHNATVGHGDSQHPRMFNADNTLARCCCYSSAPMPTCCMSALLNPKLASPHDSTKATESAFIASSPTATAATAQPLFRRRRSRCDDEDASTAFSSMMDQNGHSHIAQQEIMAFAEAARITRTIGAAVIKRQAASINRQLLQFQMMQQEQEQKEHARSFSQAPVSNHKRRKVQTQDQTCDGADYVVQNEETHNDQEWHDEQVQQEAYQEEQQQAQNDAIWDQVDRMKRMSMFLKNAQLAQSLFLQEMNECVMERTFMQQHQEDLGASTTATTHTR